ARDVLIVAPLAAILGVTVGSLLGLIMGYYRGLVDDVISRIIEAFLSLPVILVALLTLVVLGSSTLVVVLVVGILFTPIVARTVRSAVIAERDLDYVTSAKLRGESGLFILAREIFPNVRGPIIVELTVRFGYAIFTVATLSFLGVGIQPPSPDWGLSISEEYNNMISGKWWPTLFPALAIASCVVAVNLIADALQSVASE
nr:ABC transporter permease [Chloroflexota bacterium]